MLNRIPGKIPGPKQPFSWPIGLGLIGFATGITALGGLIGGPGLAVSLKSLLSLTIYAVAGLAVLTAALLWTIQSSAIHHARVCGVVHSDHGHECSAHAGYRLRHYRCRHHQWFHV